MLKIFSIAYLFTFFEGFLNLLYLISYFYHPVYLIYYLKLIYYLFRIPKTQLHTLHLMNDFSLKLKSTLLGNHQQLNYYLELLDYYFESLR
jgi:hypothetical protein